MNQEELAARLVALEQYVVKVAKSTQEPLLDLIDWGLEESFNELGRTRGDILALKAFARALAATAPDRAALAAAFENALALAENDALLLALPERSMAAAHEGIAATAAALRRDLEAAPNVG